MNEDFSGIRQDVDRCVNDVILHRLEIMRWAGYPTEAELEEQRSEAQAEADAWRERQLAMLDEGRPASVAANIALIDAKAARNRKELHEQFGPYDRKQKPGHANRQ